MDFAYDLELDVVGNDGAFAGDLARESFRGLSGGDSEVDISLRLMASGADTMRLW